MDLIVEMRFGSHLYGTDTPQSDLDIKAVYLPSPEDILLQRVKPSVSWNRAKLFGEKNAPGDVDQDAYSLQRYLGLLAAGQTVALDMLFAPESALISPPSKLWKELQVNSHRLVSRRASAFVRYCRQQANKYGIKGSRVAIAREALGILSDAEQRHGRTAKLDMIAEVLEAFADNEHVAIVDIPKPDQGTLRHIDICGRKLSWTASIKTAQDIVQRLVDEYGQRALQAERDEGVDWKALSHAVRVGREAIELLETGRIRFPLDYADHIRSIKTGSIPYATVAEEIEGLLVVVEKAAATSTLPEAPDQSFIDTFVMEAYKGQIVRSPHDR